MWWSEGAAYGMVDENGARRYDLAHDVERGAYNQGGNAIVFDNVSDETDGLMAEWSIGHEQGQVNRGSLKLSC